MWSFLFLKSQFKIQHQQRKRHDDCIGKDHRKIIFHDSIDQPDGHVGNKNQNHPY